VHTAATAETSVNNHFTRQYIPEDNSEHHTRRHENLKSHLSLICYNTCVIISTVIVHITVPQLQSSGSASVISFF
jgi:hypothetical protein